jgi:hypothetical protein
VKEKIPSVSLRKSITDLAAYAANSLPLAYAQSTNTWRIRFKFRESGVGPRVRCIRRNLICMRITHQIPFYFSTYTFLLLAKFTKNRLSVTLTQTTGIHFSWTRICFFSATYFWNTWNFISLNFSHRCICVTVSLRFFWSETSRNSFALTCFYSCSSFNCRKRSSSSSVIWLTEKNASSFCGPLFNYNILS